MTSTPRRLCLKPISTLAKGQPRQSRLTAPSNRLATPTLGRPAPPTTTFSALSLGRPQRPPRHLSSDPEDGYPAPWDRAKETFGQYKPTVQTVWRTLDETRRLPPIAQTSESQTVVQKLSPAAREDSDRSFSAQSPQPLICSLECPPGASEDRRQRTALARRIYHFDASFDSGDRLDSEADMPLLLLAERSHCDTEVGQERLTTAKKLYCAEPRLRPRIHPLVLPPASLPSNSSVLPPCAF
ncbi:hypothetical protein C8R46DRAFT_1313570 [Mycena filopes]|nr:hypothetical protein C8R46DRAFT_1313570 [Mycena filopes]